MTIYRLDDIKLNIEMLYFLYTTPSSLKYKSMVCLNIEFRLIDFPLGRFPRSRVVHSRLDLEPRSFTAQARKNEESFHSGQHGIEEAHVYPRNITRKLIHGSSFSSFNK